MSRPPDDTLPTAERVLDKYFTRLTVRTDIEGALNRLDKLTQEEARMLLPRPSKSYTISREE